MYSCCYDSFRQRYNVEIVQHGKRVEVEVALQSENIKVKGTWFRDFRSLPDSSTLFVTLNYCREGWDECNFVYVIQKPKNIYLFIISQCWASIYAFFFSIIELSRLLKHFSNFSQRSDDDVGGVENDDENVCENINLESSIVVPRKAYCECWTNDTCDYFPWYHCTIHGVLIVESRESVGNEVNPRRALECV